MFLPFQMVVVKLQTAQTTEKQTNKHVIMLCIDSHMSLIYQSNRVLSTMTYMKLSQLLNGMMQEEL